MVVQTRTNFESAKLSANETIEGHRYDFIAVDTAGVPQFSFFLSMPGIRYVNFLSDIVKPIAYEIGIDPENDLNKDHVAAWVGFINNYTRIGWEAWDWPEMDITEERAFRSIWNSSKAFLRNNRANLPDECFYIPSLLGGLNPYYIVNTAAPIDPPIGTLPTNTTYFTPNTLSDFYIDYDQDCRRAIGRVFGVYNANPWTDPHFYFNARRRGPFWRPSDKGIDVRATTQYTVWVRFQVRVSKFTWVNYDPTHAYNTADIVFDPTSGQCFRALSPTTNNPPSNASFWGLIPMPYRLAQYVIYSAASCAAEEGEQQKFLMAKADECLSREIEKMIEEGQKFPTYRTGFRGRRWGWYDWDYEYVMQSTTLTPTGPTTPTTTITDVCQDIQGTPQEETMSTVEGQVTPIPLGKDYVDVVFNVQKLDAAGNPTSAWNFLSLDVEYPTLTPPGKISIETVTAKTPTGFRVLFNSGPLDANYSLRWRVRGG